jgi:hypothetical protein
MEALRGIRRGTEEISETTLRFNEACKRNVKVCEQVQVPNRYRYQTVEDIIHERK